MSSDRIARSNDRQPLGGVIHTYQKFNPKSFPSPTSPPPDVVSPAFQHMLVYGSMRELTEEELARAIHIDPRQIASLGPSLESLIAMLLERKRKILATYETETVQQEVRDRWQKEYRRVRMPKPLTGTYYAAVRGEQLYDLERLWYRIERKRPDIAARLLTLMDLLGQKYQVDELAAKYEFTGRTPMDVPAALTVKEELEAIDRLLEQLRKAAETGQIGLIDMEALAEFAEPGDMERLNALQQYIQDYLRELAERQGLEKTEGGYRLTPKAMRLFQSRLLQEIFSDLKAARSGRHTGPIIGEGPVEIQQTKTYEFGDSLTHMDIPASMINAMIRQGPGVPVRIGPDDIEIHRTRNNPKCATAVVIDMSGSMRYGGQYINAKRMGLALHGLIRTEYPGDFLQFIEMYTFAKPRHISELPGLMPKPVTVTDPTVALKADMSRPELTEFDIPPHFTNIQHALQLARQYLSVQDTPNRQVVLLTDGLPTAHYDGNFLYLLYPPHPLTEEATLREAGRCAQEGITINIFLLPNWAQSSEDVQFAHRLAESTRGRVFFTGGRDLDRYVLWDYVRRRRLMIA
ncbi:MAG TPA: hypothetical protein PLL20_08640 [Phycisphaerae bacterium]|nr:hypothetical protein [Phycisphaerae bacterium]HRR85377.1 hypothetical protein [Phycisphaerae bacterium]